MVAWGKETVTRGWAGEGEEGARCTGLHKGAAQWQQDGHDTDVSLEQRAWRCDRTTLKMRGRLPGSRSDDSR
jgi:hypothetical protein